MTLIVIAFICLFVLTMACIHLGTKYLETRRKKRIVRMLQVITAEAAVVTTSLLKDQGKPGGSSSLERVFKSLDIVRRADDMIQQAALSWSTTRLFRTMAVMAMPGLLMGILFPVLLNAPVTGLVLGTVGSS